MGGQERVRRTRWATARRRGAPRVPAPGRPALGHSHLGPSPCPTLCPAPTSLEQAGPVAALQRAVPALKPELVLALECTHADCLHQRLRHTRVPAAHAPLLALQLQPVTGLVVCLGSRLQLQGQWEDGQGLTACQPGHREARVSALAETRVLAKGAHCWDLQEPRTLPGASACPSAPVPAYPAGGGEDLSSGSLCRWPLG